uniref:Uncharacterized protein n=1 Tax=Ditylum brightwellii TaxID=49249 RepID=A0A7S4SYG7_9STRA|mmetsp:Transcript_33258/g.44127  ORF Transcript_33258/g.44127 Transcript_33258/m.44127 type:complete len:219 (-) Transcript_33258:200-856(-)
MLSGATAKAIVRRSRPKCSALSSQINSFVLPKRTYTSNPPAHSPLLEGTNHKCHRYNPSAERASSSCAATVPEPEEKIVNFLDNTIRLVIEAEKEGQGMLLSNALSSTKKTERMTDEELQMRVNVFENLFAEAQRCIEDCSDSATSSFFDEEAENATEAVNAACIAYADILEDLERDNAQTNVDDCEASRRSTIQRLHGIKVEELKDELNIILDGLHH